MQLRLGILPLLLFILSGCSSSSSTTPSPTPNVLVQVLLTPTDGSLNPDLWTPLKAPSFDLAALSPEGCGQHCAAAQWRAPSGFLFIWLSQHSDPLTAEAVLQATGRAFTKAGFQQRYHSWVEGLPEHAWLGTKFEEDLAYFLFASQDRELTLTMVFAVKPTVLTDKERSQLLNEDAPQVHYVFDLAKDQWTRINNTLP